MQNSAKLGQNQQLLELSKVKKGGICSKIIARVLKVDHTFGGKKELCHADKNEPVKKTSTIA